MVEFPNKVFNMGKPKKLAPGPTRARSKLKTTPISLRVSDTHLAELSVLERLDGVQRSAHIQRAIAEYLERRRAGAQPPY